MAKENLKAVIQGVAAEMGGTVGENVPFSETVKSLKVDLRTGANIADKSYTAKQSTMWDNIIWRISEDIIKRVIYTSPFRVFDKIMDVGGDIQESFIRLKDALDRNSLTNSNLFTNYYDKVDVAWHRINAEKVIPVTYKDFEIRKIVSDWSTLTNWVAAIIDNLKQSFEVFYTDRVKQLIFDGYGTGQIQALDLPDYTTDAGAKTAGALLNTVWDEMSLEPNTDYISYNLSQEGQATPLKNRANEVPYLIATAEMLRNVEFLTAVQHFYNQFLDGDKNYDYQNKVIKVKDFPSKVVDASTPNGLTFTPPATLKTIKAMLVSPDFFVFRTQFETQLEFKNAITGNHTVAHHFDGIFSFSPWQKAVVFVS